MITEVLAALFDKDSITSTGTLAAGSAATIALQPENDEWVWITNIDVSLTKKGNLKFYKIPANTTFSSTTSPTIKDLSWDNLTGAVLSWLGCNHVYDYNRRFHTRIQNDDAVNATFKVNIDYFVIKNQIFLGMRAKLANMFGIVFQNG